jgi:nucleotide-binding universal stress UspA family protein
MNKTRIVVGADGSAGSVAAVRWAAAEARRRKAELRVLTAYHRQPEGGDAAAVVHDAIAHARSAAPDVEMRCLALQGYAVPMLLHAAEDAAMLVLGDKRTGRFPGLPSGSVSSQVALQAQCCVTVVRGRSDAETGPVVAGVDDEPESAVLGRAFEEAALRGAPVVAITAQSGNGRSEGPELDAWRGKYPGVEAQSEIVAGRADTILVQRSREAQLVVVSPRRHGYQGVMLGAVGSRLLDRADCPVLIARA